jgi:hypothetical protein
MKKKKVKIKKKPKKRVGKVVYDCTNFDGVDIVNKVTYSGDIVKLSK